VRDYFKAAVQAGAPTMGDGGATLKSTILAYINEHPVDELAAEHVKAK
jgi:hypothetical protein